VGRRLIDVHTVRLSMFERRMLLHEIVGYRVEVVDGITDRRLVGDSQHPYVHLLRQVRRIGFAPDAPLEERLQRRPMLGEQPLHERGLRVSCRHGDA
jgi:hypothetical protein